jgi:glucosamine--fructose-6-phosphate aminotransferase (isomerizing)
MTVPERPTRHPFNLYRAIHAQPEAFADAIARNRDGIDALARDIAGFERLFLVGIGTSWHAALMGEHYMREYGAGLTCVPVHSFDFVHYGPTLTARDCVIVISHTGRKSYSVAALDRATGTDCRVVLLAGDGGGEQHPSVDHIFETVPQEQSATYTVSYIGALAVLAALAERVGSQRGASRDLPSDFFTHHALAALRGALETEQAARDLATGHAGHRRYWLVGAGPAGVTAQEAALKIKEASYLQAEGMPIEQMFHGPFQCAEPDDLFVLVAPAGPGQARTLQLAGPIREIGARYLVVSDGSAEAAREGADGWLTVPPLPETFAALTCLVPLQFLSYWLALERGANPDRFRLDDPRFMRAFQMNTL